MTLQYVAHVLIYKSFLHPILHANLTTVQCEVHRAEGTLVIYTPQASIRLTKTLPRADYTLDVVPTLKKLSALRTGATSYALASHSTLWYPLRGWLTDVLSKGVEGAVSEMPMGSVPQNPGLRERGRQM